MLLFSLLIFVLSCPMRLLFFGWRDSSNRPINIVDRNVLFHSLLALLHIGLSYEDRINRVHINNVL
jgi:hypothetical protein